MALRITVRCRAFSHVGNFEILEYIEIAGIIDDQPMTGLMSILVTHVRLILWGVRRLAIGFLSVFGAFLASVYPPLLFCTLSSGLLDPFLLYRLKIEGLPIGGHQGLGDPAISAERTLGEWVGRQVAQILGYSLGRDVNIFSE
jgi:hypothetical protein